MNAGHLATAAVVLAVAGVAVASLVDSGRADVGRRAASPLGGDRRADRVDAGPGGRDRLAGRAAGAAADRSSRGRSPGRIARRLPACRWASTDLATGADTDVTPPGRCPLWLPGWRYSFEFAVEQSANAPIVRGVTVREGTRAAGSIELPHEPTGGAAGTAGRPVRAVPARRPAGDPAVPRRPVRAARAGLRAGGVRQRVPVPRRRRLQRRARPRRARLRRAGAVRPADRRTASSWRSPSATVASTSTAAASGSAATRCRRASRPRACSTADAAGGGKAVLLRVQPTVGRRHPRAARGDGQGRSHARSARC